MAKRTAEKVFQITVLDWHKHNPRADRGGFSWFKLDNQFHLHMRERRGYSAIATNLAVLIFEESSRIDGKPIRLRRGFAAKLLGYTPQAVETALEELSQGHDEVGGEIRLEEVSSALQESPSLDTTRDDTRRHDTDTPTAAAPARLEFESIYQKYPRKEGRAKGLQVCKAQIRSPEDLAALSAAVDRYSEHVRRERTDPKYIKHFSTFMSSWRDWLEPDAGTVSRPAAAEPEWKRKVREEEAKKHAAS